MQQSQTIKGTAKFKIIHLEHPIEYALLDFQHHLAAVDFELYQVHCTQGFTDIFRQTQTYAEYTPKL